MSNYKCRLLDDYNIKECQKEYKDALNSGTYDIVDSKIKERIKLMNKIYSIKEIKNIFIQELNDHNLKNKYIINILIAIFVPQILNIIHDGIVIVIIQILLTISICVYLMIDINKNNNTNFLKYFIEQIDEYEQEQKYIEYKPNKELTKTIDNTQNL